MSRLNEQQRRWYAALEAKRLGHGGMRLISQITGLDVNTIRRGRRELAENLQDRPIGRVRLPGGGRKPLEKKKPQLLEKLESVIAEDTAGDPCSSSKWIRRSLRWVSEILRQTVAPISPVTVRRLLKQQDYSLKANQKSIERTQVPSRDKQFRYIRRIKSLFERHQYPIISVDAKKKEAIGNFKNDGQQWCQEAQKVKTHDFIKIQEGELKSVPYGIYEPTHNHGYVYVGTSGNTASFAVEAIRRWWQRQDRRRFGDESKLLILCDAGGSNGYRVRNWKKQLQEQLAERFNLEVMVCHYPPGTSKWNPIEHRLFSFISINWAAQPLRSLKKMLALIRGTHTQTGLRVKATELKGHFPTQVKVSDEEMAQLNLVRRRICPQWNYCLKPRTSPESSKV